MSYSFTATGHENITALHKTTLEFTKDSSVTLNGDCIVGVNATFDIKELKKFLCQQKIKITLRAGGITEEIIAQPNSMFASEREMVVRIGGYMSERTFAVHADTSASRLSRAFKTRLRDPATIVTVTVCPYEN